MITIRFKHLRSGEYSVFLDDYNKGKRQRTFLGLRVTKDYSKNRFVVKEDLPAMEKAQKIAQDMSATENVAVLPEENLCLSLITFLERQVNKTDKKSYSCSSLIKHLQTYSSKKDLPFRIVTEKWITGFRDYLNGIMADTTVNATIWSLKGNLNEALRLGYIQNNPLSETKVVHIRKDRSYLTDAEIEVLVNTPINANQQVFQAFFFSLYTGLTLEQVATLTWEQIGIEGKNKQEIWSVNVKSYANRIQYTNELNAQAVEILRELKPVNVCNATPNVYTDAINVKKCSRNVFNNLPNTSNINIKLRLWGAMAGLSKSLCFIMARNTFAMKHIEGGADIRQVRRLLNVKSYGTAEVYQRMSKNKPNDQSQI